MQKKICTVYGEGAVTKFCAGDFSLDDAPWSGRPAEVKSDQNRDIKNNQHSTTQETADILKMSKSIVIGENENVSFIEKKHMGFWPTQ